MEKCGQGYVHMGTCRRVVAKYGNVTQSKGIFLSSKAEWRDEM